MHIYIERANVTQWCGAIRSPGREKPDENGLELWANKHYFELAGLGNLENI